MILGVASATIMAIEVRMDRAIGPGAPKHSHTEAARAMLLDGHSLRTTQQMLASRGVRISVTTLSRIRAGVSRRISLLDTHERRLRRPVQCPTCRVPVIISPCRICGADWPAELDELDRVRERRELVAKQTRPQPWQAKIT